MAEFTTRIFVLFAIGALFALVWTTADVLLLGFGGIVLAVAVRAAADALGKWLPLSSRWSCAVVVFGALVLLVVLAVTIGDEVAGQFGELRQRLPEAINHLVERIEDDPLGQALLSQASDISPSALLTSARAITAASTTVDAVANLLLVVLVALYLAFNPGLYTQGVLKLVPAGRRQGARAALGATGSALRRWLLGQLISMASVGILTGVGLWLLDIPLAFILGLVAGLLEFIPIIGPFIAAIPGILLAFTLGPREAMYVAGVYFVVQQLEGALIMPLAQKWAVKLPPALGLLAIVIFGMLFGLWGVLFATPLTIVIMVLVKRFYVEPNEAHGAS